MKGEVPMSGLWDSIDEASIISAINSYLETKIAYKDVEKHYDVIGEVDVKEWKVGDNCWRIITQFLPDSNEYIHDYNVSMYLFDWKTRPYIHDYSLINEMAIDRIHFFVRIDIADNTWKIEEVLDPTY